jgi:pimeloyl-ACP methyl ester carboxylesterase
MLPLAEAGFHVVAPDMPGYGRSDKPDVVYDIDFLNGCLAALIGTLGHERAVLAGHDWGGLLVWPFARMFPERTAGIIGVNTPDLPRTPIPFVELLRQINPDNPVYIVQFQERGAAEYFIERDIDAFVDTMFRGPATVRHEVFTPDVLRVYADAFRPYGAITPPLEYYRNLDRNWELSAAWHDRPITVPCLMISAAGDPVLRPEMTAGMEDRIPELEKVIIDDCGHWTQQEQPDATTQHMLSYLRRLPRWP